MARERNGSLPGVKGRNQKCVRYNNMRGDNFRVYATFGSENSITLMFFHCFIKCYESKARGNSECDGLKKFPELQGVMEKFLPVESLPADFEERLKADKISTLAKLASDQAKKAAGIYERSQVGDRVGLRVVSTSLDIVLGSSGRKRENEKASKIYDRNKVLYNANPSERNQAAPASGGQFFGASTSQNVMLSSVPCDGPLVVPMSLLLHGGTMIQLDNPEGRPVSLMLLVVKSDLMIWSNGLEMKERLGVDSRSSPVQLPEGGGCDASHPQYRDTCREDMVSAMEDGLPDVAPMEDVTTSLGLVPRLTGRKRANEGDVYSPVYNGDEDIVQQQQMKRPMENPIPPSPLGSQLEGSGIRGGGENVRSPGSQILDDLDKKNPQLVDPVDGGQQHDDELLAQEGDDNQTNYLDNMEVDASNATYHVSAGLRVELRSCPSGSDRVQQFHGTGAKGVECNASHPRSNKICGEDMVTAVEEGNMDGLSVMFTSLDGVPSSTGRNRANFGDGNQQPLGTDGLISVESSALDQEDFDRSKCEQYAENLLDSYSMPNPEEYMNNGGAADPVRHIVNDIWLPQSGGATRNRLDKPEGRPPTSLHHNEFEQLKKFLLEADPNELSEALDDISNTLDRNRLKEIHAQLEGYITPDDLSPFSKAEEGDDNQTNYLEIVGASNSSQIAEHEQFPCNFQQFLDEWDAEQGDDIQTNHLDDMQVEEISAADPVSAGCQVDARFSLSRNTPEEILPLPQVGERSGGVNEGFYSIDTFPA